jgi:uncharacterized peroxidase-related enzyme
MSHEKMGFTLDALAWNAWLPTVDDGSLTEAQTEVLNWIKPSADSRQYYATLAHDPEVLRARTELFNAVMYAQGGLPRAERELGTVAASRINGCVFCASVHARAYARLTKSTDSIGRLLDQGVETDGLSEREQAIVDYGAKLTRAPHALSAADLKPLRDLGMSDLEILDLTNAVAMFANANRLMQTLGEPSVSPTNTPPI